MLIHAHKYEVDCEFSGIHKHTMKGYVYNTVGLKSLHFHFYKGVSSYLDHAHIFSGFTGKPIKSKYGHVHKIKGYIDTSHDHKHRYEGYTFEDTAYNSGTEAAGPEI